MEQEVQSLQNELVFLRRETDRLRRNGVEALAAYQRKKERADELLETVVELQRRYDDLLEDKAKGVAETEATVGGLRERVRSLEEELEAKDRLLGLLKAAAADTPEGPTRNGPALPPSACDATDTGPFAASAPSTILPSSTSQSVDGVAEYVRSACGAVEQKHAELLAVVGKALKVIATQKSTVHDPGRASAFKREADECAGSSTSVSEQVGMVMELLLARVCDRDEYARRVQNVFHGVAEESVDTTEHHLRHSIRGLLDDFARVQAFQGLELNVCNEAAREETEARVNGLKGELEGVRTQLESVQALNEDLRAKALHQAEKDRGAIQELEVTLQLSEGAFTKQALAQQELVASLQQRVNDLEQELCEAQAGHAQEQAKIVLVEKQLQDAKERLRCEEACQEPGHPSTPGPGADERCSDATTSAHRAALDQKEAELRRLRVELTQLKRQLESKKHDVALLQRYITSRATTSAAGLQNLTIPPVGRSSSALSSGASTPVWMREDVN